MEYSGQQPKVNENGSPRLLGRITIMVVVHADGSPHDASDSARLLNIVYEYILPYDALVHTVPVYHIDISRQMHLVE
jgi:hypothetical protein